jgi:hypothetical protein
VKLFKGQRAFTVHALDARSSFGFPIHDLSDFVGALTDSVKEPEYASDGSENRKADGYPFRFAVAVLSHGAPIEQRALLMQVQTRSDHFQMQILGVQESAVFEFALVDVLVYGHRRVQTHIW